MLNIYGSPKRNEWMNGNGYCVRCVYVCSTRCWWVQYCVFHSQEHSKYQNAVASNHWAHIPTLNNLMKTLLTLSNRLAKWYFGCNSNGRGLIDHHHQQIPSNTHSIADYSVIERAMNVIELNRYDDDKAYKRWNFGGKNGKNGWKSAHLSVNITEMLMNEDDGVKFFVKNSNGKCDFRLHDRSNILVLYNWIITWMKYVSVTYYTLI